MVKFNLCSYLTELITFKKLPALLLFSFQSPVFNISLHATRLILPQKLV